MHGLLDLPSSDLLRIVSIWMKRIFADAPEQTIHVIYRAAAFVIPGAIYLWSKHPDRRLWLATSLACIAVIQLAWRVELRYFLPVLSVLLIAAVYGLEQICGSRRALNNATATLLIASRAVAGVSGITRLLRLQSRELKQAGEYVKQHSADVDGVLAESIQSLFYRERPGELLEGLSPADRDNLAAAIGTRKTQWAVADSRLAQEVPSLMWLDDEALTHARFPDWKAIEFGGGLTVLVWEVP